MVKRGALAERCGKCNVKRHKFALFGIRLHLCFKLLSLYKFQQYKLPIFIS